MFAQRKLFIAVTSWSFNEIIKVIGLEFPVIRFILLPMLTGLLLMVPQSEAGN